MSKEFSFEITPGTPGVFKQVVPGAFKVRKAREVTLLFLKHAIGAPLFIKILLDKITALNKQAF
jgi:hypothetical protein